MPEASQSVYRIIVVGAGVSGLAAAYRISQRQSILGRPTELYVLEASDRPGGLIRSEKRDGFLLEQAADGFLTLKPRALELASEMGLSRELLDTNTRFRRSFIVRGGKLLPIPEGFYLLAPSRVLPLVFSDVLSLKGKWRALKELTIPGRPPVDESLASFVRRRFGQEVLERLAQPLAGGIYGADPEKLGMRATFPQFLKLEEGGSVLRGLGKRREASSASGARYQLFATFKSGMQTLVDQLVDRLARGVVRTNETVQALVFEKDRGLWKLDLADGQSIEAHAVCLAIPAPQAAALLRPLDSLLAGWINEVLYTDAMTAYFAFPENKIKHPMNGFGLVIPEIERKSFSACTFVHRKYAGRAPKGMALLRVFIGGQTAARESSWNDADLQSKVLGDLRSLLGIQGPPALSVFYRSPRSMPVYGVGHVERVEAIEKRAAQWPGLYLAGNWLTGVGVPDSIDSGERAGERLLAAALRY